MAAGIKASPPTWAGVTPTQRMCSYAATPATVPPSSANQKSIEATRVSILHDSRVFVNPTLLFPLSYPADVSPSRVGPPTHPVPNDFHDLQLADGHQDLLWCARVLG